MFFFTKAKRAQNVNDYESWNEGGVAPTLNAMDNNGEAYATVLIIDGTRVNDVRVYEDGIVPTVISRYGTGGGNVPMVFPIDDARELEKHQNGTGIGAEGAPAYTLDRQQAPAVVAVDFYNASISDVSQTIKSHSPNDVNIGGVIVAPTLSASNNPSRSPQSSEITAQVDAMVRATNVVRRLTPVECERLQGFPDGWTDGQADSNRYKQMGNAVAVPVVEWIISRMVADE
jgi:DNA (cytosine-5)-methyltransferase 1